MTTRALLAVLLAIGTVLVPGAAAEEPEEPPVQVLDHPDGDHDSPGVGLLAVVAALAAIGLVLRRR